MADVREPKADPGLSADSVSELVQRATRQTAELVKQEMKLAQLEVKEKGKQVGIGAGMFGAAGVLAFYGGAVLIAAAVLGLAEAVDAWLSALIIGAVLLAVAGIVGLVAKGKTAEGMPPKPEKAMASVQDDVDHIKEKAAR